MRSSMLRGSRMKVGKTTRLRSAPGLSCDIMCMSTVSGVSVNLAAVVDTMNIAGGVITKRQEAHTIALLGLDDGAVILHLANTSVGGRGGTCSAMRIEVSGWSGYVYCRGEIGGKEFIGTFACDVSSFVFVCLLFFSLSCSRLGRTSSGLRPATPSSQARGDLSGVHLLVFSVWFVGGCRCRCSRGCSCGCSVAPTNPSFHQFARRYLYVTCAVVRPSSFFGTRRLLRRLRRLPWVSRLSQR